MTATREPRPAGLRAVKGHGTENDFVVLPDPDGVLELTPELVRALTDRRAGIGGDGVLRVVRSVHVPGAPTEAEWFMDYRNADGSLAEMCGNGVRVFARYLAEQGAIGSSAAIGTRGGTVHAVLGDDGSVAVELGRPRLLADRPVVSAALHRQPRPAGCAGISVEMPNPHVVVRLDNAGELAALDLTVPPEVTPAGPDGQNVEFAVTVGPRHVRMRVFERGVGETRSCGTGIAAVVAALGSADGSSWRVDVPGGTCFVRWDADGIVLTGPAVLVGEIELSAEWLEAARR